MALEWIASSTYRFRLPEMPPPYTRTPSSLSRLSAALPLGMCVQSETKQPPYRQAQLGI